VFAKQMGVQLQMLGSVTVRSAKRLCRALLVAGFQPGRIQ
jgi:hypothetical protein